jgi:hypothetical protein
MLTTDISTSFEMKKQTVVAFLDVSGAYDDVLIDVSFELIFVQLTRISDTYAILVVSWLRRPARHSAFFFAATNVVLFSRKHLRSPVSIQIGGTLLPQVVRYKSFEVFFDAGLRWGTQPEKVYVQKRCLQRLNFLKSIADV